MIARMSSARKETVERAQRIGLSEGQKLILKALEAWFDENPEPPKSMAEIGRLAGVSQSFVGLVMPALEKLGYVEVCRDVKGRIRQYGIILMMALGEEMD